MGARVRARVGVGVRARARVRVGVGVRARARVRVGVGAGRVTYGHVQGGLAALWGGSVVIEAARYEEHVARLQRDLGT